MTSIDTSSLADDVLETLRFHAVAMHEAGNTQVSIALALGVHQNTVSRWLKTDYPTIRKRAKKEGAVIHWGDETGLSNQANDGRRFAPKGRTPVIQQTARRRTTSMISSITNRGQARFMIYQGALNADLFVTFLKRLIKAAQQKVFLIVDNLRVHKAHKVSAWAERHKDRIDLFFLPAYAPENNPNEFLNNDAKQSMAKRPPAKSKGALKAKLRAYMRGLQRRPSKIRSFFSTPSTCYAA